MPWKRRRMCSFQVAAMNSKSQIMMDGGARIEEMETTCPVIHLSRMESWISPQPLEKSLRKSFRGISMIWAPIRCARSWQSQGGLVRESHRFKDYESANGPNNNSRISSTSEKRRGTTTRHRPSSSSTCPKASVIFKICTRKLNENTRLLP